MERYRHVLVIGGTGMLAVASRTLAGQCDVLTSVARTERSLRALDEAISRSGCTHHTLALDWSSPDAFLAALTAHIKEVGAPSLVVAWLHHDRLGPEIARCVGASGAPCAFCQVRGSAAARPAAHGDDLATDERIPENVTYRQVILGFRLVDGGSRWLTHDEISDGVLAAIADPQPVQVIGTVTPWERRP